MVENKAKRYECILLGTAVGDSLGLPAEGMSPQLIAKRWQKEWRQRLFFGHGMVSDDTEHTVFVANCLRRHSNDPEKFQRKLAWCLRGWLASLPPGIGLATARSILKLWLGFPPNRSGVFSAGNGPAMRAAILGVYFAEQPEKIPHFIRASTRLTHTDSRAEIAALAVAMTAAHAATAPANQPMDLQKILALWRSIGRDNDEWQQCLCRLEDAFTKRWTVNMLAENMGLKQGVTGYAYHTVPIALYSFCLNDGDYRKTLEEALNCGGDTDSVGAICGGLAALRADIPQEWIDGIMDWPISVSYLLHLANMLVSDEKQVTPYRWAFMPVRNLFMWGVIIGHSARRLFDYVTPQPLP